MSLKVIFEHLKFCSVELSHRFLGTFSYTCSTFDFCKEKYIMSGVLIMQETINNLNSILNLLINHKNANLINRTLNLGREFVFFEKQQMLTVGAARRKFPLIT